MLSYAIKRVIRSFGLFAALLLGVALASAFFAGVNVGADTTAKAALNQQLSRVVVDVVIGGYNLQGSVVWANAASEVVKVNGVPGAEVISRAYLWGNTTFENYTSLQIVGISNASRVYDGLTVTSGVNVLGENETYVWVGSKDADKIALNSTFVMNFTYWVWRGSKQEEITASLSLRAVGFVELDSKAYSIATGDIWYSPTPIQPLQEQSYADYGENLFIVDWEKTVARFLDNLPSDVQYYSNLFTTQIFAYVDREALINPWDTAASLQAVQTVTAQVNQKIAEYGMYANNNLEQVLMMYQYTSMTMRFSFLIVALPVFFVAWYVGTTVSDVSYNLRRREIGLLLTKGFSNGQLFRMFLAESIMIGIIGGLIGIGLGYLLSPFFVTAIGGELGTTPVLSTEVIIIAMIFSLAITLLSTFRPSRRASKLAAVDALKEYIYMEEIKPYKQRWPWVAFAVGTYKIVMFIFGINLFQIFTTRPMPSSNIIIIILLGFWIFLDYFILNNIGPLLFFWGFTKIFIRGSLKFQELVTRAARFLGDLGTLATRNVQRNPARVASVAFLIALIIGYSFQTVGIVASEQDYIVRQVKASVGADISVEPAYTSNVSQLTSDVFHIASAIETLSGVASTTLEYSFSGTLPGQPYSIQLRAVDPETWLSTAYYEDDWFSGNNVATAFQQMKTNNQTIILELNTAKSLAKNVGDNVTLTIGTLTQKLAIVGFFGREATQQYSYGSAFWSYVPIGFYKSLDLEWYPSVKILVKLKPFADGESVATEIRNEMRENVTYVRSVAEELKTYQTNLQLTGPLNIQRVGVIFSILAAAVATGLVTLVSLQERKREASIMSARGLSFKQLVTMFLAENLAIMVFVTIIGSVVGLIVVHGHVAASNTTLVYYSLVAHRITFPFDAIILLLVCIVLVFASAIVPLILLAKRYVSKTERIVRL